MPFIRSNRTDIRRRVMREAIAADAEVAVESVRAKQRRRTRDREETDEPESRSNKRDPGYSQAVRRACQQRLVQLIPVRRGNLFLAIAGMWTLWSLLLLAHYWVHGSATSTKPLLPMAYLVHLRSTHGIAHWIGGQLWMLAALASVMIFQLRKHKLDDYRAKYRIWGLVAVAALISSFDASSSALYLLGTSIDGWAQREIGYSGWALVLATFSTLIGLLGLRICTEIKSAPISLFFWLTGLVAWAVSALLGTKLLISPWSQVTTDLVIGGAWLGGILSVFLATGIYLRHIYIQAQKRFVQRNRMLGSGQGWRLPRVPKISLGWRRRSSNINENENQEDKVEVEVEVEKRAERKSRREVDRDETLDREPVKKRSWLRLPRWKTPSKLGEDYSDVSAEQRTRDDGFEEPLGKKQGWFSRKPKTDAEKHSNERSNVSEKRPTSQKREAELRDDSVPDFQEVSSPRRSWWKRKPKADTVDRKIKDDDREKKSKGDNSTEKKRRWFQKSSRPVVEKEKKEDGDRPKTKGLMGWMKRKPKVEKTSNSSSTSSSKTSAGASSRSTSQAESNASSSKSSPSERPKRKLFGFLDSLKLKPPTENKNKSVAASESSTRPPLPSSSAAQRHDPPQNSSADQSSSSSQRDYADEDYDDDSNRNLSKAERKRMRRQQDNRRAA